MPTSSFAAALTDEWQRRRQANPRFSARAFARMIGISHSALSRLLREKQRPSIATIERAGRKLGWSEARIATLAGAETVRRIETAAASPRFIADARWLASQTNLTLDQVQIALHEALRTSRVDMAARHSLKVTA